MKGSWSPPSSPRSSSYPAPKEALGSAVLSQALGSQGRLCSLRDVLCSTEQAAGNCRHSAPLKALPKGAQVPWEVSLCWVPVLGGDSPENTQGIQELQGCGRIQAGRLL